jgi:hypothetical protein
MYRIVKRIVHTITTVTLLVRWEDPATQETVEKQITLPASDSLREEEVVDEVNVPKQVSQSSNPILDSEASPKRSGVG